VTVRLMGLRVRIPLERGCMSFVSVVCCQVEFSVTGRLLMQRSPTQRVCVPLSVIICNSNPLHVE
jgi:hypothetical protein